MNFRIGAYFSFLLATSVNIVFASEGGVRALTGNQQCSTIAEIACNTEGFSTLCAAVKAAGLENALDGTATFTVFAPTDEAFADLPTGTVEALLDAIPALTNILLFHAVNGKKVYSNSLKCQEKIEMANGKDSRTVCRGNNVFQKGAGNPRQDMPRIISTDIEACNGLIHVVDGVMLPPNVNVPVPAPTTPATPAPTQTDGGTTVAPSERIVTFCDSSDDCPEGRFCFGGSCIRSGNPRFTLEWFGDDDLDLHVITPGGSEIYFENLRDPQSGGFLDIDIIPSVIGRTDFWVENIVFPVDGSAPDGIYTFFVVNFEQIGTSADGWGLSVWDGDRLERMLNGTTVGTGSQSESFTIELPFN